jgi:adenosylcobinamide kinase/adenosylcobinamide-phosphate guanylyltransferase
MPVGPPTAPRDRTLVLGGVRSGKSRLAERLAAGSGLEVVYVATALPGDDAGMQARIAAHRARRPSAWRLVEEPLALAATLQATCAARRCVLVDCLTVWLANLLWCPDPDRLQAEVDAFHALLPALPGQLVLVSNEVNLGFMPMDADARRYGDLAGELHQRLAAACDRVVFTVAGLPLVLKGALIPPGQPDPPGQNE